MKVEYGHAVYCDANDNGTVKGGGEKVGYTGGDAVVVTGGTSPGGGKGDDCGGGRPRWSGVIKEGIKTEYPRRWSNVNEYKKGKLKQIVTEPSVSLAYFQGVEHHRPNMCTPSGHGDRPRRRISI